VDLDRARDVAVEAAEAAGALLRRGEREPLAIRAKGDHGDVVTELDLAAERLILDRLRSAYPAHQIIAEESGVVGAAAECVWLVDPLDGTNNVAIGLPVYSVGIALCAGKVPVVGVVHDPVSGETWSATREGGARGPGDKPLLPAAESPARGDRPVLAWTQGHTVTRSDRTARALRLVLENRALRVLQLWAPLLSWVMLARGHIDGVVGYRTELVDLPAGALIALEAGIEMYGFDGAPYDQRIDRPEQSRTFVAARPGLVPDLLAMVESATELESGLPELR
jgi:myo-inositol-1(or 4)-monophosphatase